MKYTANTYICDGCGKRNMQEHRPPGWYIIESNITGDCLSQSEIHACEDCGIFLRVWLPKLGVRHKRVPPKEGELPDERAWGRFTIGVVPREAKEPAQDGACTPPAYYGVPIKLADGRSVQTIFALDPDDPARQAFEQKREETCYPILKSRLCQGLITALRTSKKWYKAFALRYRLPSRMK